MQVSALLLLLTPCMLKAPEILYDFDCLPIKEYSLRRFSAL
jgi:hypothetical protein